MIISKTVMVKWNMNTRKHYEEKGYVFTKFKDEFEVKVEDLTKNSHAVVEVLCDYCKENISQKQYNQYLKCRETTGHDCCSNVECMNEKRKEVNIIRYGVTSPMKRSEVRDKVSKSQRLDYNYIRESFLERNYILLTENYINCEQKLEYICLDHKDYGIQTVTWHDFNDGCGCYCCGVETSKQKRIKRTMEELIKIYDDNGFILIKKEYINGNTPMAFICKKHKNIGVQYKSLYKVLNGQGCKYCGIDKVSGENCYHWKGGKTEIDIALRNMLSDIKWKYKSLLEHGFRCAITGIDKKFEIHHLYSFNKIVDDVLDRLKLEVKRNISDYTTEEWTKIKREFIQYHELNLGIPMTSKIHILYHNIFGDDNTKEQFQEFTINYYKGLYDYKLDEEFKSYNSIKRLTELGVAI